MRGSDYPIDLLLTNLEDFTNNEDDDDDKKRMKIPCRRTSPPTSIESSPGTSPRSSFRSGRSVNPLPRHKRESHINAESRRRTKIQKGFDTLKGLVPALGESTSAKESKAIMLFKAADHCRQLKSDSRWQQDETNALKKELEALGAEIHSFQKELPPAGISMVKPPPCHSEHSFDEYIHRRTCENWKFWMFSFIIRPLYESYNRLVSTRTVEDFLGSVISWAESHLSLINLRPVVLTTLRNISRETSIMSTPEKLPKEALQKMLEAQQVHPGPITPTSDQQMPMIVADNLPSPSKYPTTSNHSSLTALAATTMTTAHHSGHSAMTTATATTSHYSGHSGMNDQSGYFSSDIPMSVDITPISTHNDQLFQQANGHSLLTLTTIHGSYTPVAATNTLVSHTPGVDVHNSVLDQSPIVSDNIYSSMCINQLNITDVNFDLEMDLLSDQIAFNIDPFSNGHHTNLESDHSNFS